jgi:glycosyltransferase involved in cell wall biosynthesis
MIIRFFNTYEPVSAFYRDLVPYLAGQGIRISIVVSKGEYRRGRDLVKALRETQGVKLKRTANMGLHAYEGWFAKTTVTLLYALRASLHAFFGPSVNVNVFLTQPPLISLLGYLLSIVRKQPYYCVVMDIQPQLSLALGLIREGSLLTRLLRRLSSLSLQRATGVIVIGQCMAKQVGKIGVSPERIHLIRNWADEQIISPVAHSENPVRKTQGWEDKFVVMYAGNIGIPQYFDDILNVAKRLRGHPELLLVFIGGGSRQDEIKAYIQRHKLNNVVLLPFLHEQYPLASILSAGDLHLVTLRVECTGLAVPSKIYGIIAAGRPVIYQGSSDAEIARMVVEEQVGAVVQIGDVEGLRSRLLKYLENVELLRRQGLRARELAETRYSRNVSLEKYASLLTG